MHGAWPGDQQALNAPAHRSSGITRFFSLLQPDSSSGNSELNGFLYFFHAPESNLICFLSCLFRVATAERTRTDKGRKREGCSSDFPFYLWWRCAAKCKNRSWCWQFCPFLIPGWHFGALSSTLCESSAQAEGWGKGLHPVCGWLWRKQKQEWTFYSSWRRHRGLNLALLKLKSKEWVLWMMREKLGTRDTAKSSQRRVGEISL